MSRTLPRPSTLEHALSPVEFIEMLERHGAVFSWRKDDPGSWLLDLNGVEGMTNEEAADIAATLGEIRDEVRQYLLQRDAIPFTGERIH